MGFIYNDVAWAGGVMEGLGRGGGKQNSQQTAMDLLCPCLKGPMKPKPSSGHHVLLKDARGAETP